MSEGTTDGATDGVPENAADESGQAKRPKRVLTVFGITMMTTAIITSINGAPTMAEWGLSLVTVYIVVAIVFLVPSALISAELATGWPADGGVYVWVREAFGERWGFVAVWMQWAENVIWFPSVLMVAVTTGLYIFGAQDLAQNKYVLYFCIVGIYWILTFVNLAGMKASARVASIGTIGGRIIPIIFMIALAVAWLALGDPSAIEFNLESLIPPLSDYNHLAFVIGAFLTFAGIETTASNAAFAKNPRRDYPIAILIAACIAFFIVTAAALSMAIVIPGTKIAINNVMTAVAMVLDSLHLKWALPILAFLIVVGMLAEINSWIGAPTRGLLIAGREGNLPRSLQKVNKQGIQKTLLLAQAVFVTVFSLAIIAFGGQVGFWITTALPTQVYLIMYFLMFAAGVRLRYTHPEIPRRFRVPVGNFGIWFLALLGIAGGLVAIAFGFIPIAQVGPSEYTAYVVTMVVGFVVITALPFAIHHWRRPHWKTADGKEALIATPSMLPPHWDAGEAKNLGPPPPADE